MTVANRYMFLAAALFGLALAGGSTSLAFQQMTEPSSAESSDSKKDPHGGDAERKRAMLNALIMMQEGDSDAVVARVNGADITMRELTGKFMDMLERKYQNSAISKDMAQRLRLDTLEKVIMEELAYQRGLALGITVEPDLLATTMESIKNKGGGEKLIQEHEIHRYLIVKETVIRDIYNQISISDEEVDEIYEEVKDELVEPEQVVITDVVFFLDPELESSKKKVNEVRRAILNEHSGNPARMDGNGFVVQARQEVSVNYKPLVYEAAKKMEAGVLSEALVIDGTLHLLKLEYYRPRKELSETEARKYITSKMKATRKNELMSQWRQKLRREADVEIDYELLQ